MTEVLSLNKVKKHRDMSLHKIEISGPTLASLIQRVSSSPGDIDGLLFGHVTYTRALTLSDNSSDEATLIATVTSFFSSTSTATFYSPSGQINSSILTSLISGENHLIGWFSGRRKTHLRPSMRESSVTASLSSTLELSSQINNSPHTFPPCVFFLLTTPFHDQFIHTHEYKAFQFVDSSFQPKTLDVVNLGPAFRGHYGNFTPNSPFPDLPFQVKAGFNSQNMDMDHMVEDENEKFGKLCHQDFQIGKLKNLMGSEASTYTAELEELYNNMINKINSLAKLVEQSSSTLLQQENHNMKLRHKVAGFE